MFSTDIEQMLMVEGKGSEDKRPCAVLYDSQPQHIKDEREEVCISLRGEQLNGKEELDAIRFSVTASPIKNVDDTQPRMLLQLRPDQIRAQEPLGENDVRDSFRVQDHGDGSMSLKTEDSEEDEEDINVKHPAPKLKHLSNSGPETEVMNSFLEDRRTPESDKTSGIPEHLVDSLTDTINVNSQRKFCCQLCGHSFGQKSALNRHMKIHKAQENMCCDLCGQRFRQKRHLNGSDRGSFLPTARARHTYKLTQDMGLFHELDTQDASSSCTENSTSSSDYSKEEETLAAGPDSNPEEEDVGEDTGREMEEEMEEFGGDIDPIWISRSGIIWSLAPDSGLCFEPEEIRCPGITRYAMSRIENIQDSFDFFLTEEILNIIVRHTNAEGRRKHANWTEVDMVELRAFFGLLILAGVHRSRGEATRNLWGEETGRPIFRATMSLKRFTALTATIRFDDRLARRALHSDKLAPLREIWDLWVARLPLAYYPGEDVCVDNRLVPFRGKCSFRKFMPSKPEKYGLMLWTVCDVASSYVWCMMPYLGGRNPDAPEVVLELTEGLSGHTITTDNFFSSLALGEELLKKKMCLVGTVRRKKLELPPQLLQKSGREALSSLFAFTSTTTAVSYVPKPGQNVLLISTRHRRAAVQDEPQRKPTILHDYNRCIRAVNNLDKVYLILFK